MRDVLRYLIGVMLALSTGCAAGPGPTPTDARPRLDAIAGRTQVVPIGDEWLSDLRVDASGAVAAVFEDGTRCPVRLHELRVIPSPVGIDDLNADRWLPLPGIWVDRPLTRTDLTTFRAGPASRLVLVIDVPEGRPGSTIRFRTKQIDVNWLTSAEDSARSNPKLLDAGGPWEPTMSLELATSKNFAALSWPESRNPLGRWRYRMLTDGLRPLHQSVGSSKAFESGVAEAIARQNEDRWAVALARLWEDDSGLCERLRRALTSVVDFGNSVIAPAWPSDHAPLDELLYAVLDPRATPRSRTQSVERWLDRRAPAVAWIVDDAGLSDSTAEGRVATIGIANLAMLSTLAWTTSSESTEDKPVLTTLEPGKTLQIPLRPPAGVGAAGPRVPQAHLGTWSKELPVAWEATPVTPPGLTIGPMLRDLSMDHWMHGRAAVAPDAWSARGMLQARTFEGPNQSGPTFEIVLTCTFDQAKTDGASRGSAEATEDAVRFYFGPFGNPRSVLRVNRAGQVAEEARRTDIIETPQVRSSVSGVASQDGGAGTWSIRLPVPKECIASDGTLLVSVVRSDSSGRRTSWPRAMLPWQHEPGRAAIDTRAWTTGRR